MAGSVLRSKMRSLRQGKAEESKGEEKPRFVLSFCTQHKRLRKPMGVNTPYLHLLYVHERSCAGQKREGNQVFLLSFESLIFPFRSP